MLCLLLGGAILDIGAMQGVHAIRFRTLRNIGFGWLLTPVVSLILAAAGYAIVTPVMQTQ
jgi:phosphate/sulfate permease